MLAYRAQGAGIFAIGEYLGSFDARERVMIYNANALMIYSIFDADDIPRQVADDIHAFRRDFLFLQKYMKNHATHFLQFQNPTKKKIAFFIFSLKSTITSLFVTPQRISFIEEYIFLLFSHRAFIFRKVVL